MQNDFSTPRGSLLRSAAAGLCLITLSACAVSAGVSVQPQAAATRAPEAEPRSDDLWTRYGKAVEATKYPSSMAVSTGLLPLVRSTPGLVWDAQGRVLMATWTKAKYYAASVGKDYTLEHGDLWLTAVPSVRELCRSKTLPADQVAARLKERLGLPPSAENDAFVELWVDPAKLFRPCLDPEVTDRECVASLVADPPKQGTECPFAGSFEGQVSRGFVSVTHEHLDWMCQNWTRTFTGTAQTSYPWTALGYTYDWAHPEDPKGESEVIAPRGTTVTIATVTPTLAYCGKGE